MTTEHDPMDPPLICVVCGREVEKRRGRGRPRSFHPECKTLGGLLEWLPDQIAAVEPLMTPEAKRQMRSRLWVLANYMNGERREL